MIELTNSPIDKKDLPITFPTNLPPILFNHLHPKINQKQELIQSAIQKVLASGRVILGPAVTQFEQEFAAYIGGEWCRGCANGTDALELGLKAGEIGAGDLVATVANAGMYTTCAINAIGAIPYFMDVDPQNYLVTLEEVSKAVAANAKAIVVTHLYGLAIPEIANIARYCRQQGVLLVEDCAQAHGAKINNRCVGSFGDLGAFSFYPTKNLGALGDGGAIVTSNAKIAQRFTQLRQYGWRNKYQAEIAGARNSRLDDLQAALLSAFLPHLDMENAARRAIAQKYRTQITHPYLLMPGGGLEENYVAHLFVLKTSRREQLRAYLQHQQIATDIHYPLLDYQQPLWAGKYQKIHLPNSEQLASQILTLPCYPDLPLEQVEQVINTINDWHP